MERGQADVKYATVYRVWQTLRELEAERGETTVDSCTKEICWVTTEKTGCDAKRRMPTNNYFQLPVRDPGDDVMRAVGSVTERNLLSASTLDTSIRDLMGPPFVEVPPETRRDAVAELLREGADALLVRDPSEGYAGIVTPANLV